MKRVWPWFRSLSRSSQIGVCVALIHLGVIAALLINHAASSHPKTKARIAVRTMLIPRKEIVRAAPAQAVKQGPAQTSNPSPKTVQRQPEKKAAPPFLEKKPAAAPKPQIQTKNGAPLQIQKKNDSPPKDSKPPANTVDNSLFQELADSLEALAAPKPQAAARSKFTVSLPQSIEINKPVAQSSLSSDASEYGEIVLAILQNSLELPEFGEVVARIEIDAYGAVVSCEILDERSRKNGQFLKNRLQELTFPCFNEFRLSENRLNFTVIFRNAENR